MFFTQGRQRRLAVPRREGHDRFQGQSRAGRRRVRQGVAVQAPRQQRRVRGEAALKGSDHRRAVAAPRAAGEVRESPSIYTYVFSPTAFPMFPLTIAYFLNSLTCVPVYPTCVC